MQHQYAVLLDMSPIPFSQVLVGSFTVGAFRKITDYAVHMQLIDEKTHNYIKGFLTLDRFIKLPKNDKST
jgi:hypothetical protein